MICDLVDEGDQEVKKVVKELNQAK